MFSQTPHTQTVCAPRLPQVNIGQITGGLHLPPPQALRICASTSKRLETSAKRNAPWEEENRKVKLPLLADLLDEREARIRGSSYNIKMHKVVL